MRHLCTILFFAIVPALVHAQQGFNKGYDFGGGATVFENLLVDNDTIVLIGVSLLDGDSLSSKFWLKMDTLGNVLTYEQYRDSAGASISYYFNTSLAKLSDKSAYAFISTTYQRRLPMFNIVDKNGNLQYQHEYALPANTKDLRIRNFIETAAGFLFAGSQDGITGANDDRVILLITGKTGDLLSRKLLTNEYYYTYVSAIQKIDENTFIITGGAQLDYVNSWDTNSYFPFLIAVDSTGNEKWRWQLPPNDNEVSFGGICRRPDGGWVYGSARKVVTGTGPSEYGYQSRIVSRNAAMQLEWSQNLGDKQFSRMGSIQATPDGNYLAYGSDLFVDYDLFQGGLMGTIRKFTPDGDSVWQRTDTIGSYSQGTGFRSYEGHYGGLGFLSSGSIVACGYNRVEHGTSNRQLAWLVKISPDGCIDTLNCVPGVVGIKEPPALGSGEASVYPNPASDHFQVLYDLKSPGGAFLLFDAMGRLVRSRVLEDGSGSLSVEVSGLPAGVYAWALRAVGGGVLSGRVLLGMER